MDLDEVRTVYRTLNFPKFVCVKYVTSKKDVRVAYYFLKDVFDMPLDKMPREHRKDFGPGKKKPIPPYAVFGTFLNEEGISCGFCD